MAGLAAAAASLPNAETTAFANRSLSPPPPARESTRVCPDMFGATGVPVPARTSPSAILHSNTAIFNSAEAARARPTARISSTVSMTTMGVEELIRILSRSRVPGMVLTAAGTDSRKIAHSEPAGIFFGKTKVTSRQGGAFASEVEGSRRFCEMWE